MLPTVLMVLTFTALYWFPPRRWLNQWGATPPDLVRVMGGDNLLVLWNRDSWHKSRSAAPAGGSGTPPSRGNRGDLPTGARH